MNKYRFGYQNKMFTEKVSNLTKEERRAVSAKYHEVTQFRGAMRSVERQQLKKPYKKVRNLIEIVLFFCALGIALFLVEKIGYFGRNYFPFTLLAGFIVIGIPLIFFQKITETTAWILKFMQLYNESK